MSLNLEELEKQGKHLLVVEIEDVPFHILCSVCKNSLTVQEEFDKDRGLAVFLAFCEYCD